MFDISNNQIITITRGDTAYTTLYINLGTELSPLIYDLGSLDKVYFAIMEPNTSFEHALVRKVYTYQNYDYENHILKIEFNSEDTEYLIPGTYYYMVKLLRPANPLNIDDKDKIDTIISKKKFIIID